MPAARQSGPRQPATAREGKGNTWLRQPRRRPPPPPGTRPSSANGTGRIARRRGKAKAQVAVARSILVIIWHLLADPAARYPDLGPDYYATRTNRDRKIRNHIRQLQALGVSNDAITALLGKDPAAA